MPHYGGVYNICTATQKWILESGIERATLILNSLNISEDISPFRRGTGIYPGFKPWPDTDSSDSHLVQHLLTSWQPVWQLSLFDSHTCTLTSIGGMNLRSNMSLLHCQ